MHPDDVTNNDVPDDGETRALDDDIPDDGRHMFGATALPTTDHGWGHLVDDGPRADTCLG